MKIMCMCVVGSLCGLDEIAGGLLLAMLSHTDGDGGSLMAVHRSIDSR